MLYSIIKNSALLFSKLLFRVDAMGLDNIPAQGGFILASNHVSYLDPVVLSAICPRRLNFMARHDLFLIPIFSQLISKVGAFPVKRDSADLSALKEAIHRVKKGQALLVFPEGSRSPNGDLNHPQAGIGFLASRLNVPVVPAFIKGTQIAWPKGARFIRPHKVSVFFGKGIRIERRMPYQDSAEQIMRSIRHLSCQP